nr:MAG TPA: hypothetical protein [Microviridae sp.]
MSVLSLLSGIASGSGSVGAIGSALGGVAGLLGFRRNDQKQQLKFQKELMSYQNQLNQQNALLDYERQRQLTQDSPSLYKIGLKQAGINAAFVNGGSQVGAASNVNPISSASASSPLPTQSQVDSQYSQMINDSASALSNLALQRSQIGLINEQAENQRMRNLTQMQRDISELRERAANAKSLEIRNKYEQQLKDVESRYYEMNAKNKAWILENDSVMADLQAYYYGDMETAKLENLRADFLNKSEDTNLKKSERQFYKYRARLIDSQILANRASAADSFSHVGVNNSQASLNLSEENLNKVEHYIKNATKEDVIKAAQLAAKEHGPQSLSEYSWSVFNDWDNASDAAKWKASLSLIPQILGTALGGAASSASIAYGEEKGKQFATKKPKKIGFK